MEIGVVGEKIKVAEKGRSRSGRSGPGDKGGGGDDRNRGGGGEDIPYPTEKSFSKSKILTGFLLIVVLMTFGGIFGAYIVIATNGVLEWQPFNLPIQVYFSTALIFASSATYVLAQRAIDKNNFEKTRKWLYATNALGGTFIASQLIVWIMLNARGLYMQANPYAAFFYFMTVVHAVHVLGGVVALGYITLRTARRTEDLTEMSYRSDIAQSVGWYWHFMGGLWIVLLLLLGFWK